NAPHSAMHPFPTRRSSDLTKWFDCDRIKGTPTLRFRQEGDYITLPGGKKKALRRYMIDEKIPGQMRDGIPLLADGSHIIWVIGRSEEHTSELQSRFDLVCR